MGVRTKKLSTENAPDKLSLLQEQLYLKAYAQAKARWVISSPEIKDYAASFLQALPAKFKVVGHEALIARMTPGRFVLYGDFHTLKQAQKGLVRLLTQKIEASAGETKIILAMEMFHAKDQRLIDAYCALKVSEQEFLDKIQYAQTWGFPWKNYKLILDFAHERGIKVVGINCKDTGKNSLQKRDIFMAEQLNAWHLSHPDHVIVCLVGEYHLADKHLPAHLFALTPAPTSESSCLRIFTNIDRYYFMRPHTGLTKPTEILFLKRDHYCIINSPPWIKWQSYIIWEEMQQLYSLGGEVYADDTRDEDTSCFREDQVDLDFHLLDIARKLADFLKIEVSDLALSNFRAFHAMACVETLRYGDRKKTKATLERLAEDGYLYIPSSRTVIVSDVTLNNLAGAAGQMLQGLLAGPPERAASPEALFYGKILCHAAGMISSKIFNPRRKGKDILYYKTWLDTHKGRRLTGLARQRRFVVRGVVLFHEWLSMRLTRGPSVRPALPGVFARWDALLLEELTQNIGETLGYTLYVKMLLGYVPLETVREMYTASRPLTSSAGFMQLYRMIMH